MVHPPQGNPLEMASERRMTEVQNPTYLCVTPSTRPAVNRTIVLEYFYSTTQSEKNNSIGEQRSSSTISVKKC